MLTAKKCFELLSEWAEFCNITIMGSEKAGVIVFSPRPGFSMQYARATLNSKSNLPRVSLTLVSESDVELRAEYCILSF